MIAKLDPDKRAKWPKPSHYTDCLQCDAVTDNRLLALFLNVWVSTEITSRPSIPDQDENSRTTDEYVTSLYDKLKSALASTRDTAILEAQRHKQHYDHKAGAVELHPGDEVLVTLEAFRDQWQKLKKRWGDALYMVVKCMADRILAYDVDNDTNKKRQVLHQV